MPKRITIEIVRDAFLKAGCVLLTEEYVSNTHPLSFVCQCGTTATTTWARFRIGCLCRHCATTRANDKRRGYTIAQVKQEFSKRGMQCLEEEYRNNYTPMRYICSCGNKATIRFFCVLKGQKCDKCDSCRGSTHYNWIADRDEALFRRRFRCRVGHLVQSVLKSLGISKQFKSADILGYSTEELIQHVCSFPDWPDISKSKWHLDHIFPIKAFLDHGIYDVRLINCLENLRPLPAHENLSKHDKYNQDDFARWLASKR